MSNKKYTSGGASLSLNLQDDLRPQNVSEPPASSGAVPESRLTINTDVSKNSTSSVSGVVSLQSPGGLQRVMLPGEKTVGTCVPIEDDIKVKSFPCKQCLKLFRSKGNRNRHIRLMHKTHLPHNCNKNTNLRHLLTKINSVHTRLVS